MYLSRLCKGLCQSFSLESSFTAAHRRKAVRMHLDRLRMAFQDELARHRQSHSGVKPYPCEMCSKRFARSNHLAKHHKVHRKNAYPLFHGARGLRGDKMNVLPTD
ncbi:Krueppel-like factor 15 [Formica fusca]